MTTPCPRLRAQVAALIRMYTHLDADDLREMRDYHYCADCPGVPAPPVLSRDPQESPR